MSSITLNESLRAAIMRRDTELSMRFVALGADMSEKSFEDLVRSVIFKLDRASLAILLERQNAPLIDAASQCLVSFTTVREVRCNERGDCETIVQMLLDVIAVARERACRCNDACSSRYIVAVMHLLVYWRPACPHADCRLRAAEALLLPRGSAFVDASLLHPSHQPFKMLYVICVLHVLLNDSARCAVPSWSIEKQSEPRRKSAQCRLTLLEKQPTSLW